MRPLTRILIVVCVVIVAVAALVLIVGNRPNTRTVVVYTSVDQPFAEPILTQFETATGIDVQPVYDIEASKTTGLVNRLIAERESPTADIFWNSEFVQTLVLKTEGVLAPFTSPTTEQIPTAFRDPENYWTGFTARARVIIVNNDRVPDPSAITGLNDFLDPVWLGDSIAIANPLFGTTATHGAALYAALGQDAARDYFEKLVDGGIRIVDGNSVVRDLVADGTLAFGLTDTDDACGAFTRGAPVTLIFPDQVEDGLGTLIIPGTIALIRGAPHPDEARLLFDYLASHEVEQALINADFSHIALHEGIEEREGCVSTKNVQGMRVDYLQIYSNWDTAQAELREIVLR